MPIKIKLIMIKRNSNLITKLMIVENGQIGLPPWHQIDAFE